MKAQTPLQHSSFEYVYELYVCAQGGEYFPLFPHPQT